MFWNTAVRQRQCHLMHPLHLSHRQRATPLYLVADSQFPSTPTGRRAGSQQRRDHCPNSIGRHSTTCADLQTCPSSLYRRRPPTRQGSRRSIKQPARRPPSIALAAARAAVTRSHALTAPRTIRPPAAALVSISHSPPANRWSSQTSPPSAYTRLIQPTYNTCHPLLQARHTVKTHPVLPLRRRHRNSITLQILTRSSPHYTSQSLKSGSTTRVTVVTSTTTIYPPCLSFPLRNRQTWPTPQSR